MTAIEQKNHKLKTQQAEAISTQSCLQSDIDDLKRSNSGFEKENLSLVKDREILYESIKELTAEKTTLEEKWQKSLDNYAELLEAKEIEATNFQKGIEKLIKFKNQVKDLLQN